MQRKVSLITLLGITVLTFVLPSSAESNLTDNYDSLFFWLTLISALVLILVVALWVYFIYIFNESNEEVDRTPITHETSRKLEFGWTAVAILIVLLLMAVSYPVLFGDTNAAESDTDGFPIIVQGNNNWEWRYIYPNGTILNATTVEDGVKITEITLEINTKYTFIFQNNGQYIHSYYVPDLNIKMDVIPGVENTYTFEILQTGDYDVLCAEFCGAGHSQMRGTIFAVEAL